MEVGLLWTIGKGLVVDEEAPTVVADKTLLEILVDSGLFEGTWDEVSRSLASLSRFCVIY